MMGKWKPPKPWFVTFAFVLGITDSETTTIRITAPAERFGEVLDAWLETAAARGWTAENR